MSDEILAVSGPVALRLLNDDDADMQQLLKWLSDPRITRHVYGEGVPWTPEKVRAKFAPKARPGSATTACLILRNGQPAGYVQCYPVKRDSYLCSQPVQKQLRGAYGVDMFIGVPAWQRKGLGSAALRALEDVLRRKGVRCLCADPAADNEPGLRFWPKAGFEPIEVIEDYDDPARQSILMKKML